MPACTVLEFNNLAMLAKTVIYPARHKQLSKKKNSNETPIRRVAIRTNKNSAFSDSERGDLFS